MHLKDETSELLISIQDDEQATNLCASTLQAKMWKIIFRWRVSVESSALIPTFPTMTLDVSFGSSGQDYKVLQLVDVKLNLPGSNLFSIQRTKTHYQVKIQILFFMWFKSLCTFIFHRVFAF